MIHLLDFVGLHSTCKGKETVSNGVRDVKVGLTS